MFQDNEEEYDSIRRARFLMSPYNVREARRIRNFRNTLIGWALTIVVLAGISVIMKYCVGE